MTQSSPDKSSSTFFALLIIILLVFFGGFYYFYTNSTKSNEISDQDTPTGNEFIDGVILVTNGGQKTPILNQDGQHVMGVQYNVNGPKQGIISSVEQYLLANSWLIRFSQKVDVSDSTSVEVYVISAYNPKTEDNIQIRINSIDEMNHSISLTYS